MSGDVNGEVVDRTAAELAAMIRRRELSARELFDACLARIASVNPHVNAIVTLVADRARASARAADEATAAGAELGPLHGLPVAHKDLALTAGIRTTMGSPLFADFVPDEDELIVTRLRAAGAITIGKTNTPEFGAGSQTFNPVFGATRNPYDLSRTCGGSSGGAAVALATGMIPIADGSDMGGSLRNPASFCNVVGLRPSPGRVPAWPSMSPASTLSTEGAMGRSVADVALQMRAIAGPDERVPISLPETGAIFDVPLDIDIAGRRVAWTPDLGLPVEPAVRAALGDVPKALEALGCHVTEAMPDLAGAGRTFQVLRAWHFEQSLGEHYDRSPDQLKDTVRWNVEFARSLTLADHTRAIAERAQLQQRVRAFFAQYDVLALPAAQVVPFDVEVDWPRTIDGIEMETYIDWMRVCCDISLTGCPAISVPAAFTPAGLPVGVQFVGRPGADVELLQFARAWERANPVGDRGASLPGL